MTRGSSTDPQGNVYLYWMEEGKGKRDVGEVVEKSF